MKTLVLLAGLTAAVWGEAVPRTVSAAVSSAVAVSAGTAEFRVQFVDISQESTVESAVGVLSAAGVEASHLTGVNVAISQGFLLTTYDFAMRVPAEFFTERRDQLVTLQRNLANSQLQAIGWSSVWLATEEEKNAAMEAALPGLLEKAGARAAQLAAAMGGTLGEVHALSAPAAAGTGLNLTVSLTATYLVQAAAPPEE
jgi:hypothetical protein